MTPPRRTMVVRAAAVAAMAQRQQLHIIATAGFQQRFLWSSNGRAQRRLCRMG